MAIATGPSAGATGTLPAALQRFAHCPISDPAVTACLSASSTGTFVIGSTTLTLSGPAVLTLGLISKPNSTIAVEPTDGTPALSAPATPIPGGLLGIPGAPSTGPLEVTAQPELVAIPTVSLINLERQKGVAIELPTQIAVANPLLGSSCTIGSATTPLTLNLTDGTTNPPPPNMPIKGTLGKITGKPDGELLTTGTKLVDNAFAAPGTSGCGPFGLLDPIINAEKGLPSAAGTNSAILKGTSAVVPASLIRKYLG